MIRIICIVFMVIGGLAGLSCQNYAAATSCFCAAAVLSMNLTKTHG